MTIQEITLGNCASTTKTVTETDVYLFAGITGDLNPAHTNEVSASQTPFGGRIAHGILGAGFISAVLGMKLPGPGTIYLGQELKFTRPVRFGDTITATFEVVKKGEEVTKPDGTVKFSPGRIVMKATAVNQRGEVVVEGEACSMAAREKVDCSRF